MVIFLSFVVVVLLIVYAAAMLEFTKATRLEPPSCYNSGESLRAQSAAENDCGNCPYVKTCSEDYQNIEDAITAAGRDEVFDYVEKLGWPRGAPVPLFVWIEACEAISSRHNPKE